MKEETLFTDEEVPEASENQIPEDDFYPKPYYRYDNCIAVSKETKDGFDILPLCNFTAWVDTEIIRDNGIEPRRALRIVGAKQDGTPLPPVDVEVDELVRMKWLRNAWPSDCNLTVMNSVEKHVQYAIHSTASRAEQEKIFEITGWRKIEGAWHFLLPGNGAYAVELQGKQKNYCIEQGASEQDLAIGLALTTLDFIPHKILHPCLALVFLSPLNEFLRRAECEPKFILTLIGRTGSRKSTLAALVSSFFGKFSATDLPMSFRDTPNSITYNSFALKDVLACIDDFHPVAKTERSNMINSMQMVCRAFGDRAARNGLTSSYRLRESRPPQGNAIVTAEQIPDVGESALSRLFCIEMPQNCMQLDVLTEVQQYASDGVLRRIMGAYVEWIKARYLQDDESVERFVAELRSQYIELRDRCRAEMYERNIHFHSRTADAIACLEIGYKMMVLFYRSLIGIEEAQASESERAFHSILLELAAEQAKNVNADRPTHIYIRKLISLIECGECPVLPADAEVKSTKGFIGFEDEKYYYLFLDLSHKSVKKLCDMQGENYEITSKELAKALAQEGYIVPIYGKHTGSIRFGELQRRVMKLKKSAVDKVLDGD